MVEFITGQAGSGKTALMFERIKASESNIIQCMIVPEQYSYEFDKRLYFFLGAEAFNRLFSLSFTSLARELFQLYGDPDRNGEYVDDLARMILIYQAVNEIRKRPDGLTYFRRMSSRNGFAEEALKLISDMKRSGVMPEKLDECSLLFDDRLRDKSHDIAAVYLEYQHLMEDHGFKDHLDNIREAAKAAVLHRYFEKKNVYLDEFESFTGDQYEMLRVIISSAENVVITLRTDNVNAGKFTLFETVNNTFRQLTDICRETGQKYTVTPCGKSYRFRSADLEYLSSHIMRSVRPAPENAPKPENIHIFEARDMYGEAEYVCACIKRLIHSDSTLKYREIAVISNDINRYSDILSAAFERYDIPCFLSIERTVAHTPIMAFFTALLDLLTGRKMQSDRIFRIMKCGILDISLTDVSLLENYCYKWGVDGDMWCSPFTAPDIELPRIEKLRKDFSEPVMRLKKQLSGNISASQICALLYDHLVECHAEKNTALLMDRLIKADRDHEASELKRLWGCLIDILDSINDTLGETEISFSEAARIIRSMIGRITYSMPPQTLDAVTAASARTARLSSPRVVFVMGCCDGDFPNQVNIHGLFSETDRQKLSDQGINIARPVSDLIADERLIVYKALSSASEKLYLSYPLADLSGQVKYPARCVDQIIGMFDNEKIRIKHDDVPPHYYGVTLRSAFYHYMQDRALNNSSVSSLRRLLDTTPEYKRRIAYVLSRSGYRQEFRINSDIMKKLKSFEPLKLSSTELEQYDLCHFRYFCGYVLRLADIEKMELDARAAGELIHDCIYSILSKRTKAEFIGLSYDDIRREIDQRAEKFREEKLAGDFGKTPKGDLVFNKLIQRLPEVFLHTQQELMASDFTPCEYEMRLRDEHSVSLKFGEKYALRFGGIVDRVDICTINDKKYVRIVDYKSSRKDITAETLGSGINLQMLLYLFAVTDRGGRYEGFIPAGVLYSPLYISDIKPEESRNDAVNHAAVDRSLKTSGLVLGNMDILDAMEKGVKGRYIPVKLGKDGYPDKKSSCISGESMERLKEFTFAKLREMADSLLDGDVEAVPLLSGKNVPCRYCNYVNICDNSPVMRYRSPDTESVALAEDILSHKTDTEEETQ